MQGFQLFITDRQTSARKTVPDMTKDLVGRLFGDRGYISQALFERFLSVA